MLPERTPLAVPSTSPYVRSALVGSKPIGCGTCGRLSREFMKWNMNTGKVQRVDHEVPNAFSHFTYVYTCGEIMVLDAQGWQDPITGNFTLTDPALQTKDEQRTLPINTNFGQDAMDE